MSNNPLGWPTFQQNPQRTGATQSASLPTEFHGSFSTTLATQPNSAITVDTAGNLFVSDSADAGVLYSLSPTGSIRWRYTSSQKITAAAPLLGPDDMVYIAGTTLEGLITTSTAATQRFSVALPDGFNAVGPMVLSSDNTKVFLMLSSSTACSVIAVTLPANHGDPATQAWAATLTPKVGAATSGNTGLALGHDGHLYAGDDDGRLYRISNSGTATALQTYNFPLSTPAIDKDGTLHFLVKDPKNRKTHLQAYNPQYPDSGSQYSPSTGLGGTPINSEAMPAIASTGDIYVGFDSLYTLQWVFNPGGFSHYAKVWSADSRTDHGNKPGPIALDGDDNLAFCGMDNWLVCYKPDGTLLWNKQLTTASSSASLTAAGSICYWDERNIASSTSGGNATLAAIYQALLAHRTGSSPNFVYPVNATTVADANVLALFTTAFGAGDFLLTGKMVYTGNQLVLTGFGPFQRDTSAPMTLSVSANDANVITLDSQVSYANSTTMATLFPILSNSFWNDLHIDDLQFSQSSSTTTLATHWTVSGNVALSAPLALLADLLHQAPANAAVSGTLSINANSQPVISLGLGDVLQALLGVSWELPATVYLKTDVDATTNALVSEIELSATITVGTQAATFKASVPTSWGLVELSVSFAEPLNVTSIADLLFWPDANTNNFTAALPSQIIANPRFGLKGAQLWVSTSSRKVLSASVEFGTAGYTAFDAGSVGVPLTVSNVVFVATVVNPLSQSPKYQVSLAGDIAIGSPTPALTLNVQILGPDWDILGSAAVGTAISPTSALSTLGSSATLPASAPSANFTDINFRAQPQNGTYFAQFNSANEWTLFSVGDFSASLENFSLSVNRVISNPVSKTAIMSVQVYGQVTISTIVFDVCCYVPSSGNWKFTANLKNNVVLPSIGDLVNAIDSDLSGGLPPSISDLGSNIAIRQFDLNLGSGEGHSNAVVLALGTLRGWSGWDIFTTPFTFTLSDALVMVTAESNTTALVKANFMIGTGHDAPGVRVQLPLPFDANDMVFSLVTGDNGVPMPTVGALLDLVNSDWSTALPSAITELGSNISISRFDVTRKTTGAKDSKVTTTRLNLQVGATDTTTSWSPLGLNGFGLSGLGVGGSLVNVSSPAKTTVEGFIVGNVHIGETGYIPLKTTFQDNLNNISLTLNDAGGQATLPSVKDIIGLFSPSWANALPTAVTDVGQFMALNTFALTKNGNAKTVAVSIGSPANWTPVTIAGCSWLTFNSYALSLYYKSVATQKWTGTLGLNVSLFSERFTINAQMPGLKFTITRNFESLNLETICQTFLSEGAVPGWLSSIGITNVTVTVYFTSPNLISISTDLGDIDIGFLGSLSGISLSAEFGGGKHTRVCLNGNWNPPGGAAIPGTFCYPFNSFKLKVDPNKKIDLPEDPKSEPANEPPAIEPGAPSGISSTIVAAAAGGAAGAAVVTGFLSWVYGSDNSSREHQTDAGKTCAAGAINYYGTNPSKEQLQTIVAALSRCFPGKTPLALAQDLVNGAQQEHVTLTANNVAFALAQGIPSATPRIIGTILNSLYPETPINTFVGYMNSANYTPEQISSTLLRLFPSNVGTAATMLAALQAGYAHASNSSLMAALHAADFSAKSCVPLFMGNTVSVNDMAGWLAGADYDALSSAQALFKYYPTDLDHATQMIAVITAAFTTLQISTMWSILYKISYHVNSVLSAMKAHYSSAYTTLIPLTDAAISAGYKADQISEQLLALYPSATPTDLLKALQGADSSLTAGEAMAALENADLTATQAATAYIAVAQRLWSQTPNAQNLANALKIGTYSAVGVMQAEHANYPSGISTPLMACQLLHTASYSKQQATAGLDFQFGETPAVAHAITEVYG